MQNVLTHNDDYCVVDQKMIDRLLALAAVHETRRARLCLHHSVNDTVQEMLIVLLHDSIVKPHCHGPGSSESYHLLQGRITVKLGSDETRLTESVRLGDADSGRPRIYRLCKPLWHTMEIESDFAVIHEIRTGPFINEDQ